jgi:glycosyltransferase involved in cell wall biosynthesis
MNNFEKIEYIYKYNNRDIKIKNESDFLEICKEKIEIEMQDLYFRICEKGVLFDKKVYENIENPKISIILTLLNRENYLLRILRSIQNQPMKDIEIIFIDDGSTDNSVNIIKFHQQYDKRIILIKHEKNEGTLKSRNDGAYMAKGEYILFSDSDDLLLYNILNKTYDAAKAGNYEIVQFAVYRRNTKGDMWNYGEIRNTTPIYQPELSSLMYYYRGYLKQTDWHIWG